MPLQQIEPVPLSRLVVASELQEHLGRLLDSSPPALFAESQVLAGQPEVCAEDVHAMAVLLTEQALRALYPDARVASKRAMSLGGKPFTGLGQSLVGEFHFDRNNPLLSRPRIAVHTTLTGGGDVYFAGMGADPEAAFALNDLSVVPEHPHHLLLRGLANGALSGAEVSLGRVREGDTVWFMEEGGRPTWHRFDTDPHLGRRTAAVTAVSF